MEGRITDRHRDGQGVAGGLDGQYWISDSDLHAEFVLPDPGGAVALAAPWEAMNPPRLPSCL